MFWKNREGREGKEGRRGVMRFTFEGLFDVVSDFIFVVNKDFEIVKINRSFAKALRMRPEELKGRKCFEVLHNSNKPCQDCLMLRTIEDKIPHTQEIYFLSINAPLFVSFSPIFDEEGEISYVVHIAKDLSEIRRVEKERDRALRRATEIIEAMADAVVILDLNGKIQQVNREFERHSGWKRDEVIGKTVEELRMMFDEERQKIINEIMPGLMKHGPQNVRLTLTRKDGTKFSALISFSLLEDVDSKPIGVISVVRDISKIDRMERALRVLSKANYAIAQAEDERELLNTICKIVVGDGGYIFAWIGYAEKDKTVRPVARGGVNDYLDIIKITWDESEAGRGPTSTAIRTKRPAVVRDITLDPLIEPWREEALTIGYASSIALPLIYQDEVLGALNIYSDKKYAFDEEEVRLLRELADNLAYGIAVMRERREKKSVEELYKTVIENTGTAMIVVDEDMRIVLANNEVERIYETSKEKIIGRSFTDFIAKDDLDKVVEYHKLRRFDVGLAPKSYEVKVVDVNGNIKHILSVVTMIPGTKQSIVSAIDVSELRKAERRAKESEERYKAIFEESPLAIMVVGVDMKIIECNNTTLKVFERRREEIVGKKWSELGIFEEAELPIIMKQFYKGLRGKSEIIEININVWGKEKWIRIVPVLLKKDGKPFAFLNMIEDVTSEKISEKRLKGMLEHIRLLLMIDKGIIAGESLDKILKDSLKILREMTGCEFACMTLSVGGIIDMIADPETFKSITTLFSDRKNIEILKIARGKGEVVRVESILELENLFEIEVELLKARMKSYILIPLMMRGEEIGSLLMASKTRISDLNFGLIRETANQLAIALHEATLYELKRKAYEQIEQNIEQFAILADHIRNPLAVILALAELEVENKETVEKIIEQVERIDEVIKKLDEGWLESEEIREFLKTSKQSH